MSDWTIARRKGPQPARPYGTPYTRSALPPIVPNGGLLSMSRSDGYRRFAAECLKMAQTAEEEQNRATFLQMARVWFALAEREEARSSRNDHPEELNAVLSTSSATFVQAASISCNTFRSSAVCTNFTRRRHSSANFRYCADDCSMREQSSVLARRSRKLSFRRLEPMMYPP